MLMLGVAISDNAQSGVTYNHDSSKKNQITVMEIGSGSLSPELYYQLLHSSYKKSAASKNKLGFRTTAGIGAYNQVEYAEVIDSALTKRAEIEALNMADRQIDLAWKVEVVAVPQESVDVVAVISVKALDAVDVEVRAAAPAHAPIPAGQPLEEGIPHSLNAVQIGGQVLRGEGQCVENAVIAEQGQAQFQLINAGAAHSRSGPLADEALAVLAAADEAGSVRREGLHKRPRPLADAYKWVSH